MMYMIIPVEHVSVRISYAKTAQTAQLNTLSHLQILNIYLNVITTTQKAHLKYSQTITKAITSISQANSTEINAMNVYSRNVKVFPLKQQQMTL